MSEVIRSCARCTRPATVTRGTAAYCLACNEIKAWAEIIEMVQMANEPLAVVGATATSGGDVSHSEPGIDPIEIADPFSRRLR